MYMTRRGIQIGIASLVLTLAPTAFAAASTYSLTNFRGGNMPIITTQQAPYYAYDPSVIYENGIYTMYWCGSSVGAISNNGHVGDNIMLAVSTSLSGPWHAYDSIATNTYDDVFWSPGGGSTFDSTHTCDPSVIKVNGTYYMYYGGAPAAGNNNAIGVASSPNGLNSWTRLNNGNPIITPKTWPTSTYGAGEPSVTYANGWYYMTYNDTTGDATYPGSSAPAYLIRATDPLFQQNAQVYLGPSTGFLARNASNATSYGFLNGINLDLQYVPAWNDFLAVSHSDLNMQHVVLFDSNFNKITDVTIPSVIWADGPAVVSLANGHQAIMNGSNIAVDVLRASTGEGPTANPPNNLAWDGADLVKTETVPTSPTGATASCMANIARYSWNPVSNAASYTFQAKDNVTSFVWNYSLNSPAQIMSGLYGSSYSWSVAACNSGGCSAASQANTFSCLPIPATPTNPTATCSNTNATYRWGTVSGATSYRLAQTDVVTGVKQIYTNITVPTEALSTLVAGRRYRWGVAACNGSGCSDQTDAGVFVCDVPVRAKPTTAITATKMNIKVGESTLIQASFLPGTGDSLLNTDIDEVASGSSSYVNKVFSGAQWSTPVQSALSYSFTPTAPGTYNFYSFVQTSAYPSWSAVAPQKVTIQVTSPAPTAVARPVTWIFSGQSTIRVGQSTTIYAGYIPAYDDQVINTDIDEAGPNTNSSVSKVFSGKQWGTAVQSLLTYTFTPTAAGSYIFSNYIQTKAFPSWSLTKQITITVLPDPSIPTPPIPTISTIPAPTATLTQPIATTTNTATVSQQFMVNWTSQNATSCDVWHANPAGATYGIASTTSGFSQGTYATVGLHHYWIDCTGPGGSVHKDLYHEIAYQGSPSTPAAVPAIPTNRSQFITEMYQCVLGRQPDSAGFTYWLNNSSSFTLASLYESWFSSSEYLSRNTSNEQFVTQLYNCIDFRQPDQGGYNGYVQAIQNNAQTRTSIVRLFVTASEFLANQGPKLSAATGIALSSNAKLDTYTITSTVSCLTGPSTSNVITIKTPYVMPANSAFNIYDNASIANGFYATSIAGQTSMSGPSGFAPSNSVANMPSAISIVPGKTYYVSLYDGALNYGSIKQFSVPLCTSRASTGDNLSQLAALYATVQSIIEALKSLGSH